MISIVKMNRMGIDSSTLKFLFEFEFDNSSTLPEKAFAVGSKTYLIADGSTAQNIITSTRYEYNKGKWTKLTTTSENTTNTNKITDNGNYSFANNDSAGFNDVTVDVSGGTPTPETFEVTIDGTISSAHSQNLTADKSIAEVVSAFNNGIVLINFGDSVKTALNEYGITLNDYSNFSFKLIDESETALIGTVGYVLSNNMMHISIYWTYSEDYSTSTIGIML